MPKLKKLQTPFLVWPSSKFLKNFKHLFFSSQYQKSWKTTGTFIIWALPMVKKNTSTLRFYHQNSPKKKCPQILMNTKAHKNHKRLFFELAVVNCQKNSQAPLYYAHHWSLEKNHNPWNAFVKSPHSVLIIFIKSFNCFCRMKISTKLKKHKNHKHHLLFCLATNSMELVLMQKGWTQL